MRIEQLHYLVEVANCKSFSIAAQNLFTTQPNISKALKMLEKELGFPLFIRQSNTIALTEDGAAIMQYACQILNQIDCITNYAHAQCKTNKKILNNLKIIYPPQIKQLLSKTYSSFKKQYPEVQVSLISYETSRILNELYHLQADIIFININSFDLAAKELLAQFHSEQYNLSFLLHERLLLLVSNQSVLTNKKEISISELSSYPLGYIQDETGGSDSLIRFLIEKYGCTVAFTVNDSEFLTQKALSGECVVLTTLSSLSPYALKEGNIISIRDNIYKSVYIAVTTDEKKNHAITAFTEMLKIQIEQDKLFAANTNNI